MNIFQLLQDRLATAEEAVRLIQSNSRIYVGGCAGVPQALIRAMVARADELRNVEVVSILTFAGGEYFAPDLSKSFRHRALFMGGNARDAVREGRADCTSIFLSEVPQLFRDGTLPLDIALIQVSPPDEHGFCSFGCEVGCTKPAAQAAKMVIAEVNVRMPRVLGDSFIHVSKLDRIVKTDYLLPEVPKGEFTETHNAIGKLIADLVPDGATLQLGIGSIPDAVLFHLKG